MRLDEYLVNEGIVSSRARAKRLIERGMVKVDGKTASKPSKKVEYGRSVAVTGEDKPEGYFKLKSVQELAGILHGGDVALDIGSSAGGFLMYASGLVSRVVGIEFSREFEEPLAEVEKEYPNVKVVFGDAFTMDVVKLGGPYDVILNDMTVEPTASIEVLKRFLPLLKEHGRVLQVAKLGASGDAAPIVKKLEETGLKVNKVIRPEKMEAYIIFLFLMDGIEDLLLLLARELSERDLRLFDEPEGLLHLLGVLGPDVQVIAGLTPGAHQAGLPDARAQPLEELLGEELIDGLLLLFLVKIHYFHLNTY
jgi:23S rRNA (cytidine1920-2'-O)/16S rRNA (cytidine1409-2'-O)-methyltransferase